MFYVMSNKLCSSYKMSFNI